MKKVGVKAEKTIVFSIIGVILIVCVSSLAYNLVNERNTLSGITGFAVSSERVADNINFQRYNCMKELTIKGADTYGLDNNLMSKFVDSNIQDCMSQTIKRYSRNFIINSTLQSINLTINASNVDITAKFPITLTKEGITESLDGNFSLMLDLSKIS